MLDIQFVRDNAELVQEKSKQKGFDVDIRQIIGFDDRRRELQKQVDDLRRQRHQLAVVAKGQKPTAAALAKGRALKDRLAKLERQLAVIERECVALLKTVPNMPTDDTPVGDSEADNRVIKTVGPPRQFDFKPKSDAELGTVGDFIDKDRAAKVAGSRFVYLKGEAVRLQFGLINYVMDVLSSEDRLREIINQNKLNVSAKPFRPILPPPLIKTDVYDATARLNGAETTYKLADEELWLNASAEHSLAPMYMNEILAEEDLPIRYLGYATSFRREAGSYGKDMEGLFRLHHFDKLEMVSFSTPETSCDEHLLMIAAQEHLMQGLGIPYQVVLKCTADIGQPNARGVDINAWMPAQGAYRETHTADLITDYQARRLKTRFRRTQGGQIELVHNNDATALALGRMIKAIVENYQTPDGGFDMPPALEPYLTKGKP